MMNTRILLIDDDRRILETFTRALELAGYWVFSVADNGIGIDSKTRSIQGWASGWRCASALWSDHGGRIWVKSEVGEGSTFTFTLPARPTI